MNKDKFNYYYKKVIDIQKTKNRGLDLVPWEEKAITDGLINILNANFEHILTDSFLDYISHGSTIGFNFEDLSGDENSVLFLLSFYFQSITGQYMFTPNNEDSRFGFVKLLDGEIKQATHILYEYQHKTTEYKIDDAMYCLLAYCFMNNCVDKFKGYCEQIFDNENELLDFIYLNNYLDGPDGWYTFIKTYIIEYLNKKIKVIK